MYFPVCQGAKEDEIQREHKNVVSSITFSLTSIHKFAGDICIFKNN